MKKYLIIGNGVAGTTAAHEIRKNDPEGLITILTAESIPFYSRIRLPDYVTGIINQSDLIINKEQWYLDQKIELKTNVTITGVDSENKNATDQNNRCWEYDTLLIATGSNSFVPPIKGCDKDNVFTLRTFEDAAKITDASTHAKSVVVIGGGLLGIEAAHALIKKGLSVTIVEFFDWLLPRQMDKQGAALLKTMLEDQGFEFRLGAKTKEIKGDKAVTGVELESGEILNADFILVSAGVRSNLDLPVLLGLETGQMGVIVNSSMETSLEGVYAAGDVAQFDQFNFCIWPEAQEQGKIAGANMAKKAAAEQFEPIIPSNRLKVAGIDLASAGNIDPENSLESDIEASEHLYKKMVKKDGKLVGCIMLGNTKGFSDVVKQIGDNNS